MKIQTNVRAGLASTTRPGVGRCGGVVIPPLKAPGNKAA
jgi:hypothetical protein